MRRTNVGRHSRCQRVSNGSVSVGLCPTRPLRRPGLVLHGRDISATRLPGLAETTSETLTELSAVAEQFILSYKDRGKPLPVEITSSPDGKGGISVAV